MICPEVEASGMRICTLGGDKVTNNRVSTQCGAGLGNEEEKAEVMVIVVYMWPPH